MALVLTEVKSESYLEKSCIQGYLFLGNDRYFQTLVFHIKLFNRAFNFSITVTSGVPGFVYSRLSFKITA